MPNAAKVVGQSGYWLAEVPVIIHRMTRFMIGNGAPFAFADNAALLLDAADQRLFDSFLKIEHRDDFIAAGALLIRALV